MNLRTFAAVGCLLAYSCYGVAETTVTFATLNCEWLIREKIHMKYGEPPISDPAVAEEKFISGCKAVAQFIAQINADVIGLQEVGPEADIQTLRQEVSAAGVNYLHVAVGRSLDPETKQNTALLSKLPLSDTLEVIPGRESYDTELDDAESELTATVSKGLRTCVDVAGTPIYVYVLHLKSERGGHESDAWRIAQASIVRRHYLPLLREGRRLVVMGDLNDDRGQPAIRRIRGRDDIDADLIETGEAAYFERDKLWTRWTYEFQGVRGQLDHILLSESLVEAAQENGVRARTLRASDRDATDHSAFIVAIELR